MISGYVFIDIAIKIVVVAVALDFMIYGFLLIINRESLYKIKFLAYFFHNTFKIKNYRGNWKLVYLVKSNKAIGCYLLLGGFFLILDYVLGN